jgi:TPR repeat protein
MRLLKLLLLLLMCAAEPAVAGPFEEAKVAYHEGDYTTARRLWPPLVGKGDPFAQYYLGVMYRYGRGVPQDYVLAHMWFTLAMARFDKAEKHDRGVALVAREFIVDNMTPAQIAEAQKLAREWKPQPER